MAVALERFVKQLEESGIVAAGKLENFIPPKAHPKDAELSTSGDDGWHRVASLVSGCSRSKSCRRCVAVVGSFANGTSPSPGKNVQATLLNLPRSNPIIVLIAVGSV